MTSTATRQGVTLIELLIVVLILAALAAIAVPRVSKSATNAKEKACDSNVDVINTEIEAYNVDHGAYPNNLKDVTEDTAYFPDGPPTCPLGGKYKIDNIAKRAYCTH